ncbi:MAG TPA: hypothetical protein DIW46_04675, partial [Microbacterium sp.]|nr:hypothetical protein [Microbacterium sp.]
YPDRGNLGKYRYCARHGGDLATTGADSTTLIVSAVLLLALGLGLFAVRRRLRAE